MKFKELMECLTLETLKKAYKKLAIKHHPDLGGDLEIMKFLNNEYERLFEKLKTSHNTRAKNKEKGFYNTSEKSSDFMDIVEKLIGCEGLIIEVCGNWIWLSGETKKHKDLIKEIGFKYASKKKMWFWRADEYKSYNRKAKSMNEIRDYYGSDVIRTNTRPVLT